MTDLTQNPDPYAEIVDFYDLEHDDFGDDVPFYLNSITSVGDPVLELGCGTGRLLRPIAKAGFRVTGVDSSPPMLRKAQGSFSPALRKRITLHEGLMEEASRAPGGPFGVVIFGLNGLLHLADSRAQLRALRSAREALDPRGQLLIDVFNPTLETLRHFEIGVAHEGTWVSDGGDQVDKFSARKVSTSSQLIQTRIWYDITRPTGELRRVTTSFDLRYLHRNELELMLDIAGFCDFQIYGGYELEPYDDTSDRLIIAADVRAIP